MTIPGLNGTLGPISQWIDNFRKGFEFLTSGPENIADTLINGQSTDVNYEIAKQNLKEQQKRNEIEDARYEEETAYNRAWAENERDYNRALQEQMFEREDTALERQASSLSAMGINPLGQSMNGLGAGSVVGSASPSQMSSRGGTALYNDFQMAPAGILGPVLDSLNAMNSLSDSYVNRDSIRQQTSLNKAIEDSQLLNNEAKAMENEVYADQHDIQDGKLSKSYVQKDQDFKELDYNTKNVEYEDKWFDANRKYVTFMNNDSSIFGKMAGDLTYSLAGALKGGKQLLNNAQSFGETVATKNAQFLENAKNKFNEFKNHKKAPLLNEEQSKKASDDWERVKKSNRRYTH